MLTKTAQDAVTDAIENESHTVKGETADARHFASVQGAFNNAELYATECGIGEEEFRAELVRRGYFDTRFYITSKHVGCGRYYYQIADGCLKRIPRSRFFSYMSQNVAIEIGFLDAQKHLKGQR